jgi:peptide-methionine (S)-S-oxide reductase
MLRSILAAALFGMSCAVAGTAGAAEKSVIFAGGCVWCVEKDFDHVPGVISTVSGYAGGTSENPTYKNHGAAGHREVVKIDYDDAKVSFDKLLDVFWHSVDPTDGGGQFCDRGHPYTTAVYASGKDEIKAAEASKVEIAKLLGKPVVTEIAPAPAFWPAEEYHQDYYKKNPIRYRFYRSSCGRDKAIDKLWGKAAHQGIEGS